MIINRHDTHKWWRKFQQSKKVSLNSNTIATEMAKKLKHEDEAFFFSIPIVSLCFYAHLNKSLRTPWNGKHMLSTVQPQYTATYVYGSEWKCERNERKKSWQQQSLMNSCLGSVHEMLSVLKLIYSLWSWLCLSWISFAFIRPWLMCVCMLYVSFRHG